MKNTANRYRVAVIGDIVIDWMLARLPQDDLPYVPLLSVPLSGGAWFVADAIRAALDAEPIVKYELLSYATEKDKAIRHKSPIVQSVWDIQTYPKGSASDVGEVYRLKELIGYVPQTKAVHMPDFPIVIRTSTNHTAEQTMFENHTLDCVIVDDMHLGFREERHASDWKAPLSRLKPTGHIIYIVSGNELPKQSEANGLWEHLLTHHNDRTLIIISANSLREHRAFISRRISWESTAETFFNNIDTVVPLRRFNHLLVRFGVTGAIYYCRDAVPAKCSLYFDPMATDGVYRDREREGNMVGGNSVFAGWITRIAAELQLQSAQAKAALSIGDIVKQASPLIVKANQKFYRNGYGASPKELEAVGNTGIYQAFKQSNCFNRESTSMQGRLSLPSQTPCIDVTHKIKNTPLNILRTFQDTQVYGNVIDDTKQLAIQIVKDGLEQAILAAQVLAPIATFGNVVALDRATIESHRQFESAIREYVRDPHKVKPLNLAVFGQPGAGKTFTVKEIASSAYNKIHVLTCNLTLFEEEADFLTRQYVSILDVARSGHVPLMLFDEFDCEDYKYLKLFLEPMEEGTFLFNGQRLHLGKCVLVFAGGVSTSFKQFEKAFDELRDKKAPDFASRLLGHLDLVGLDKPTSADGDPAYLVRRAILMRAYLTTLGVVKRGFAKIDVRIIAALLEVSTLTHGARSIRALLNMFAKNKEEITTSGTPKQEFIAMHTSDVETFMVAINTQAHDDDSHLGPSYALPIEDTESAAEDITTD